MLVPRSDEGNHYRDYKNQQRSGVHVSNIEANRQKKEKDKKEADVKENKK